MEPDSGSESSASSSASDSEETALSSGSDDELVNEGITQNPDSTVTENTDRTDLNLVKLPAAAKKDNKNQLKKPTQGVALESKVNGDTGATVSKDLLVSFYKCDYCQEMPLVGVRYECQKCQDYDLCQKCFQSKRESNGHLATHAMTKVALVNSVLDGEQAASLSHSDENVSMNKPYSSLKESNSLKKHKSVPTSVVRKKRSRRENRTLQEAKAIVSTTGRRIKSRTAPAGASMDRMTEIVQLCELGTLRTGTISTKASNEFCEIFRAGVLVHCNQNSLKESEFVYNSVEGQTAALCALILAGIRIPKRNQKDMFAGKNTTPLRTKIILLALVDQFVEADTDRFFAAPRPKNMNQMCVTDFRTLRASLESESHNHKDGASASARLFESFRKKVRSIWQTAIKSNPSGEPEYEAARWFDQATTLVFEKVAEHLSIDHLLSAERNAPPFGNLPRSFRPSRKRMKNALHLPETSTNGTETPVYAAFDDMSFESESMDSAFNSKASNKSSKNSLKDEIDNVRMDLQSAHKKLDKLLMVLQGGFATVVAKLENI